MSIQAYIVLFSVIAMIIALAKDVMRPGLVLFSTAVLFMAIGIITKDIKVNLILVKNKNIIPPKNNKTLRKAKEIELLIIL